MKYIGRMLCPRCKKIAYAELGKIGNKFATKFSHRPYSNLTGKHEYEGVCYAWGHIKVA